MGGARTEVIVMLPCASVTWGFSGNAEIAGNVAAFPAEKPVYVMRVDELWWIWDAVGTSTGPCCLYSDSRNVPSPFHPETNDERKGNSPTLVQTEPGICIIWNLSLLPCLSGLNLLEWSWLASAIRVSDSRVGKGGAPRENHVVRVVTI
jgi:hypothetical protein